MTDDQGRREFFDLLVVIPLEEELTEFRTLFTETEDRSTASDFRCVVSAEGFDGRILVALQEKMGKTSAAQTVSSILDEYDVGLVVCLGIAGALSTDLQLGDVCYTGHVLDVYDNQRVSDSKAGKFYLEFSPTQYETPREITQALNFSRLLSPLRAGYSEWQKQQESYVRSLIPDPVKGRGGKNFALGRPNTHSGTIVCGVVSKSKSYNERLNALDRKLLAIETESGGVFAEAKRRKIPALTIRGISDFADQGKSALEKDTGGLVRRVAACNAASFLKHQLTNPRFIQNLKRELPLPFPAISDNVSRALGLPSLITELDSAIDERLRELSPEFRLQPLGYYLPVPRIKQLKNVATLGEDFKPEPTEIDRALQKRQIIFLNIPRTYPENALPWVLASDLLTTVIAEKQCVPLVIDGSNIGPPKSGLDHFYPWLNQAEKLEGAQPVLIIENVPLTSKTRLKFLVDQVQAHQEPKYIFITRGDSNIVLESEFVSQLGATVYEICEVSFFEIAHFLKKNFSMTASESEVVALRMKNTFRRFHLSAHPTYFAGIPRETLSALLQANQRAELIQLAVDGFLTFLVAADTADITLSRTTRSRFLRRLGVELRVNKRNFDHSQLIEFASEFAKEFDFEIDPIAFVHSFIEKGILHFDGERISFSLPFIESYLLALELVNNEALALKYFRPRETGFDLATFDLYAEMGASEALIALLLKELQKQPTEFKRGGEGNQHILLGDGLSPALLNDPGQLEWLRKRMKYAVTHVNDNSGDGEQKQRFMDLADHVQESAARQTKKRSEDALDQVKNELNLAVELWKIGIVLLGSGAEHLNAQKKQELIKALITLAAVILDEWTRAHQAVDFREIKKNLTSDESVKAFPKIDEIGDIEAVRKVISGFVDLLEYTFLAIPFRRITYQMCEHARQRVLAKSIESSCVEGQIEEILHAAWLADIDSKRGKPFLNKAFKKLPLARFLRYNLATHFLMRVYWHHWKAQDKQILIDAADNAIKALNRRAVKAELRREVNEENRGK